MDPKRDSGSCRRGQEARLRTAAIHESPVWFARFAAHRSRSKSRPASDPLWNASVRGRVDAGMRGIRWVHSSPSIIQGLIEVFVVIIYPTKFESPQQKSTLTWLKTKLKTFFISTLSNYVLPTDPTYSFCEPLDKQKSSADGDPEGRKMNAWSEHEQAISPPFARTRVAKQYSRYNCGEDVGTRLYPGVPTSAEISYWFWYRLFVSWRVVYMR